MAARWTQPRADCSCALPHTLTRLEDPLQVPIQFSLNLLLPAELQEGTAVLDPLPLFGKLSTPRREEKQAAAVSRVSEMVVL